MASKQEVFPATPKKKMKRREVPISPPLCKRRLTLTMLPVILEEEGISPAGDTAVTLEGDNPKDTAMSVLGEVPDNRPIPMEINIEIRDQLKREIRQFGQKYDRVYKLLEGVQGPPEVQKRMILYAMNEAARFKRQELICHLKNKLEKLESGHLLEEDNPTPNS
ncbi:integrator complex subunit 6-like [Hyaena hyaena]|uniref:integrator complex subunit 6-like n=1 Tax=Hyaena hyaena TaxID=95912 RepID=UPI001924B75D|nr:integrator complex subunit 6-like [Hyaena hyaena]